MRVVAAHLDVGRAPRLDRHVHRIEQQADWSVRPAHPTVGLSTLQVEWLPTPPDAGTCERVVVAEAVARPRRPPRMDARTRAWAGNHIFETLLAPHSRENKNKNPYQRG